MENTTKTTGGARTKYTMSYYPLSKLKHIEGNPRKWTEEATNQLSTSIDRFDAVEPLVVNFAPGREGIIIGVTGTP